MAERAEKLGHHKYANHFLEMSKNKARDYCSDEWKPIAFQEIDRFEKSRKTKEVFYLYGEAQKINYPKLDKKILENIISKKYSFIEDLKDAKKTIEKEIPEVKIELKINNNINPKIDEYCVQFIFNKRNLRKDEDPYISHKQIWVTFGTVEMPDTYKGQIIFTNEDGKILIKEKDIREIHKAFIKAAYEYAETLVENIQKNF